MLLAWRDQTRGSVKLKVNFSFQPSAFSLLTSNFRLRRPLRFSVVVLLLFFLLHTSHFTLRLRRSSAFAVRTLRYSLFGRFALRGSVSFFILSQSGFGWGVFEKI
jgi:hypothetical protein